MGLVLISNSLTITAANDKRYAERKNKSERACRKKEDITKLRGLIDMTLGKIASISFAFGANYLRILSLDSHIKHIK